MYLLNRMSVADDGFEEWREMVILPNGGFGSLAEIGFPQRGREGNPKRDSERGCETGEMQNGYGARETTSGEHRQRTRFHEYCG